MWFDKTKEEIPQTMESMARAIHVERTLPNILARITSLAVELVPSCHYSGVLLVFEKEVVTAMASSTLVVETNHLQGQLKEGPCFDAAWEETSYRVVDMRTEKRWPHFIPGARQLGVGSMIGYQLYAEQDGIAALDLYSTQPYGFTSLCEQYGRILASHAAVALNCSSTEQIAELAR
ncbi:GAF domain-containing protein [Saccharopolyspora terrae]|uniref:GAF domain-containing protein n=1 Tax=Saccharopolyspora terrae TaxID=2530384 RepID=A0A4R4V6I5_9PSEU|nr:GAF domain-containing protein [Saccharopolyspora terrae]TDD00839.1 GAF domain-containing protein [Saccharopolyspora terrae]